MAATPFVVPFGRDGASDRAARAFAQAYVKAGGEALGVENLAGAGGLAGVQLANGLARRGDAVLLLATPSTHVLLPARCGAGGAPDAAFRPLLGLGAAPNVLLASPRLAIDSVAALLEIAASRRLTYASAGAGQTIHVCTALFLEMAGIAMEHRPFEKGSALAYADLAAGTVHVYFDNLLGCRDRIEAGDGVPLAVSSQRRSPLLPHVPALAECGFPGYSLDVWMGVFGAHGDPRAIERMDTLRTDRVFIERLAALGLAGGPRSAEVFSRQVRESAPAWMRALEAAQR